MTTGYVSTSTQILFGVHTQVSSFVSLIVSLDVSYFVSGHAEQAVTFLTAAYPLYSQCWKHKSVQYTDRCLTVYTHEHCGKLKRCKVADEAPHDRSLWAMYKTMS